LEAAILHRLPESALIRIRDRL